MSHPFFILEKHILCAGYHKYLISKGDLFGMKLLILLFSFQSYLHTSLLFYLCFFPRINACFYSCLKISFGLINILIKLFIKTWVNKQL